MESKKEILERVLLLMKYDNRITLSENKINILEQQIGLDSYYERKAKSELGTTPEWKPKLKEYNGVFGKLQLPETATVIEYPKGLSLLNSGTDNKGDFFYWSKISEKYGFPEDYEFTDSSGNKIKLNKNTKFYTPTKWLNSKFNGMVTKFTIPKGTLIPNYEETGWFDADLDEWKFIELEEDKTFKIIMNLGQDEFYRSINPNYINDPRLGFSFSRGYYTLENGDYVSYNPKDYIQYNSPQYIWWLKYGFVVELVASLIITALTEGALGESIFLALSRRGLISLANKGKFTFVLDVLLNGVFNFAIAQYHFANNNDEMGRLSIIVSFIPLLSKFNSKVANFFKKSVPELELICKEILDSLEKNIQNLAGNNPDSWIKWFNSLSKDAQEVIRNVGKIKQEHIDDGMELMLETLSEKVSKSWWSKGAILRSLSTKGLNNAKGLSKLVGNFILVGVEIKSLEHFYLKIAELFGVSEYKEILAGAIIYGNEVTDIEESTGKIPTPDEVEAQINQATLEQKRDVINELVPTIGDSTWSELDKKIQESYNVEPTCPLELMYDSVNFQNGKFVGSEDLFKQYPDCKNQIDK